MTNQVVFLMTADTQLSYIFTDGRQLQGDVDWQLLMERLHLKYFKAFLDRT